MAKEMIIMFVYDTQFAKHGNDDDPASAILYFHPSWVSDQQRTSLCGQIIGTVFCLKTVFNCPRILALQSGKFSFCDYGRYILVVGTDRNVADWVLEYRTHILSSFVTIFHKDLETISCLYNNRENFSTKLYYMFDTYLKVLLYGGNIFSNIPSIQLPKSASNVFLEAIQVLRSCQKVDYVLGGTLLYHNKVVATQLSLNITKRLVLTDPYRIKSPAETVNYKFKMPIGVQLLRVYIDISDYQELLEDSTKLRTAHQYFNKKNFLKTSQSKTNTSKEPVLLTMKRDQSLIFTTVPEEDTDTCTLIKNGSISTKLQNRPKFLNLKSKTTDTKTVIKDVCRPVPSTPFIGNTSICSTPMTDLNKALHQSVMSICVNLKDNDLSDIPLKQKLNYEADPDCSQDTDSVNSLLSAVSEVSDNLMHIKDEKSTVLASLMPNVNNNFYDHCKSLSLCDIRNNASKYDMESDMVLCHFNTSLKPLYKTITDPTFPVFRPNGMPISESLHRNLICSGNVFRMHDVRNEMQQPDEGKEVWLSIKEFDVTVESGESNCKPPDINGNGYKCEGLLANKSKDEGMKKKRSKEFRRSLSLPLKSLSNEQANIQNYSGINKLSGIQLTPLLTKLSALAMDEKSSGFCSGGTTPSDYKDVKSAGKPIYSFLSNHNNPNKYEQEHVEQLKTVVLFICGQQDMVINLLIDEEACHSEDVIKNVWQTCVDYLGKLEKQIHHCLEMYPGGNCQSENSEPYSYLCMNPEWDTIQKGGPWSGMELGALTHLHRDFNNASNLTEILLRDDESIIYGHACGKTEVFYHQSTTSNAGLPTPADPMGIIPLKAKRRLERDHAIILH